MYITILGERHDSRFPAKWQEKPMHAEFDPLSTSHDRSHQDKSRIISPCRAFPTIFLRADIFLCSLCAFSEYISNSSDT
jgi:hypothetical protein